MASLWHVLRVAMAWLERHAEWLLVCGLIAAGAGNGYRWRRDRERAREVAARQAKPASLVSNEIPRVSILLPAWNEAANIGPCIQSILALRYPDIELVVCAGGDDHTFDVAGRYAASNVVVLEQYAGEGKQRALRRCFGQCTGEIIFLTDADCILDDDCFEQVVGPVAVGAEDVTSGSWKPLDSQLSNPFVIYQWVHSVYLEVVGGKYVSSLIGRNAAASRQALEQVGAFETNVPIGTDLFLSNQLLIAGHRIRFIRDSRVRTRYCETVTAYWQHLSRWFRNPVLLGMNSESITIRGRWNNLRAGGVALFMLSIPIIGGVTSKIPVYLWTAVLFDLLLRQVQAVRLAELRGVPPLESHWQYLLFLAYMVVGWIGTARGFVESFLPWRRWKW